MLLKFERPDIQTSVVQSFALAIAIAMAIAIVPKHEGWRRSNFVIQTLATLEGCANDCIEFYAPTFDLQ